MEFFLSHVAVFTPLSPPPATPPFIMLGILVSCPLLYRLLDVGLVSQPISRSHELLGLGPPEEVVPPAPGGPAPTIAVCSGGKVPMPVPLPLIVSVPVPKSPPIRPASEPHVPCLVSMTIGGLPSACAMPPAPPSGGSGDPCIARMNISSFQRFCCFLYSRRRASRYTKIVTSPAPATDAPSPMPTTAPVLRRCVLCGDSFGSRDLDAVPLDWSSVVSSVVSASAVAAADGRVVGVALLVLLLVGGNNDGSGSVELAGALREDAEEGGDVDGALVSVVVGTLVPVLILIDESTGVFGVGAEVGSVQGSDEDNVTVTDCCCAGGISEGADGVELASGVELAGGVELAVDGVKQSCGLLTTAGFFGEGTAESWKNELGVSQHLARSSA